MEVGVVVGGVVGVWYNGVASGVVRVWYNGVASNSPSTSESLIGFEKDGGVGERGVGVLSQKGLEVVELLEDVGVWYNDVASVATGVLTEVSDGAMNRGSFIEVDHDVQ